ncbi:MAG: ROK family protein [Chitinophagaceae bacterium]|nr:ROK family protein [Anaerolineae bacterium]
MNETQHPFVVGVDIGGTNMSAIVIQPSDRVILAKETVLTLPENGPEDGLRRLHDLIERTVESANVRWPAIAGIGVGCTGPLDLERGLIQNPFTLPTWDDLPVVERLKTAFQKPILLLNDAHAAALGEYQMGAGQGTHDMVYITVSTGIGGGLILNGRLYRGTQFLAGEVGHHSINYEGTPCYCGRRGCWEMYASGTAIATSAQARVVPNTQMWQLVEGQPEKITARLVSEAAQQGDPLALDIFHETGAYLGVGILNLLNILAPEIFVLGGGVIQSHALLWSSMLETVRQQRYAMSDDQIRIVPAQLGLNAGVIGAAYGLIHYLENTL